MNDYIAYLGSDKWKELRRQRIKRDRHACVICSNRYALNVHHRTYIRRGRELLDDLITLCADCHSLFHNILEKYNNAAACECSRCNSYCYLNPIGDLECVQCGVLA